MKGDSTTCGPRTAREGSGRKFRSEARQAAFAADEIIQEGMKEGFKTVLTKPLDIDFLVTLLSAMGRKFV